MRLLIKNKFFSLADGSSVTDENGTPQFYVKGKVFSATRKKRITDTAGNPLYLVRNKFWRLLRHACLIYDANGEKIAKVQSKISFRKKFTVIGYTDEIRIDGDIIARNFTVYRGDLAIGTLKQHFMVMSDTYLLDCFNDDDAPLLVALVIAVDNILDRQKD